MVWVTPIGKDKDDLKAYALCVLIIFELHGRKHEVLLIARTALPLIVVCSVLSLPVPALGHN